MYTISDIYPTALQILQDFHSGKYGPPGELRMAAASSADTPLAVQVSARMIYFYLISILAAPFSLCSCVWDMRD